MTIPVPPPSTTADYKAQLKEGQPQVAKEAPLHPNSPVYPPLPIPAASGLSPVAAEQQPGIVPPAASPAYFSDAKYPDMLVVIGACGMEGDGFRVVVESTKDGRGKGGFAEAIESLQGRDVLQLAQMYAQLQGVSNAGILRNSGPYPVDATGRAFEQMVPGVLPARYRCDIITRTTGIAGR